MFSKLRRLVNLAFIGSFFDFVIYPSLQQWRVAQWFLSFAPFLFVLRCVFQYAYICAAWSCDTSPEGIQDWWADGMDRRRYACRYAGHDSDTACTVSCSSLVWGDNYSAQSARSEGVGEWDPNHQSGQSWSSITLEFVRAWWRLAVAGRWRCDAGANRSVRLVTLERMGAWGAESCIYPAFWVGDCSGNTYAVMGVVWSDDHFAQPARSGMAGKWGLVAASVQ